jgi:hypothetical protein
LDEQEDEFDERKRDQHRGLHFADGFGLAGHAVHGTHADHAEAEGAAEGGQAKCEGKHAHCCCVIS